MEFQKFKETSSNLYLQGFINAYKAYETIFSIDFDEKEPRKQELISCSLAFLTQAYTDFQNIRILTLLENEERDEFECCYNKFITFKKEMMNNVKTNHSHQWTDIEFLEFAKAFKDVNNLLNIEQADYWLEKLEG